jgi:putative nucleotidyltransferase with HDIG domain
VSDTFPPCPQPPAYSVDWDALNERYPWMHDLTGCPQDPIHHAEGDVSLHLRMVLEELAALPDWRALSEVDRSVLFTAALLHDVAKPACTRTEPDGRVSARGHSRRGAVMARRILWRLGVRFGWRERVTALVRFHQVPFYLIERPDAERLAAEVSQTARCDHLALLAEADARGRHCYDQARLLDNIALFAEACREQGCLTGPRPFPSDHTRFLYFRDPGRHPDVLAHEDCRGEVVLMSGLPGAGKDHWLATHLPDRPVVSLDAVRDELDVEATDAQGPVRQRARELARDHLRHGRSFAWNATNLSKQVRGECLGLFAAYRMRVRIVYLEVDEHRLHAQNRRRPAPVPEAVLEHLLDRWEVPDRTEAHQVDCVVHAP